MADTLEKLFPMTPVEPVKRVTIDLFGGPGTWKSGFAGSMPGPIVVINFDRPWGYIRNLYPDKYISVVDVGVVGDLDEFTAVTTYNMVKQYIAAAMELEEGTLVIDGGTQYWTLRKMATLAPKIRERAAKGKELQPFDYDVANADALNEAGHLARSALNVVFTHQVSEVWDTDEHGKNPHPTGRQRARESSSIAHVAEVQLYTYLASPSNAVGTTLEQVPWAMVTHSKFREGVVGMKFEKPVWDDVKDWVMPL